MIRKETYKRDRREQGEVARHVIPRGILSVVMVVSGLSLCNSSLAGDPLIRQQKSVIVDAGITTNNSGSCRKPCSLTPS
jgi:hypothetical protein